MRHVLLTLMVASLGTLVRGQDVATCRDWQECRQMALAASSRGEYERFHDLAWRAVQTGPRNDPGLMYLLARAQVLSGRPHDALVMLQRLAGKSVAAGAVTDPDFQPTRELEGWPEVAATIAAAGTPPAPPAVEPARTPSGTPSALTPGAGMSPPAVSPNQPTTRRASPATERPTTASTPAPASVSQPPARPVRSDGIAPGLTAAAATPAAAIIVPPTIVPFPLEHLPTSDAVRFSARQFLAAGLAYDAVSRRFVIGDALGRKLIVVGLGADHADDMVRADSAGFDDVVALAIDEQRGDLWVASAAYTNGESALHRLQLVSGRPLKTYRAAPSLGSTRLVDLTVQASGNVIALDRSGNRLLSLARGGSDMAVAMSLKLSGATSLTSGSDSVLYVAYDDGIARIDLRAGTVAALSAPKGFDLRHFEAIRANRDVLIGLQTRLGESRQLVRLSLNAAGRAVRAASVIDSSVAETDGRISLTIAGDELYYLARETGGGPEPSSNQPRLAEPFVIQRLTLR